MSFIQLSFNFKHCFRVCLLKKKQKNKNKANKFMSEIKASA